MSGWRRTFRTVAITFVTTSAFWLGLAGWWYTSRAPSVSVFPASQPSAPRAETVPPRPSRVPLGRAKGKADLIVPVTGISFADLTDTFSQSRDNGERRHDAIDIIAPRGTPVVSATAGRVEKLFYSQAGGNTVYVRSPDGNHIFYYAHLDTYAPGLQEDAVLAAGEPIGTVGSTGNADDAVPHLHFAVWATDSSRSWSDEATPINPYPLLAPRGD